jgi:copper chaperone NosL
MAISEKRYAAEVIAADGGVFKFDDTGCFVRFVRERNLKDTAAAFFAVDFEGRGWIDAWQAVYVKSDAIPSPMASGVVAVSDRSRAAELAAKFQGRILTFEELWTSIP